MKANSVWVVEGRRVGSGRWVFVDCESNRREGLRAVRFYERHETQDQEFRLTRYVSTRKEATRG